MSNNDISKDCLGDCNMTIKMKLTLAISLLFTCILMLNISINYFTSKERLQDASEQQMLTIAEQISTTIEVSQQAREFMEDELGEKLRTAAVAAKQKLDPDIEKVTNEQLVEVSKEVGVDHISLWKKLDDDIVILRSSDPKEINLSSKTWDYWYTAFNQLFIHQHVSIPQGQKLKNYWSGPINFATSDPSKIIKWGNYYDGTTNYMINPYVSANTIIEFGKSTGTDALVKKMLQTNPNILEITGFNPAFFGKKPIIKIKQGIPVFNLDVRDIIFGSYDFRDEQNDVIQIQKAIQSQQTTTITSEINGKKVLTSYIPVMHKSPYVIAILFDQTSNMAVLKHQLFVHSMIALVLLLVTMITSYVLSGFLIRPVHQILRTVKQVAAGNFDTMIEERRSDELGLLSSQVNLMTVNLRNHTNQLKTAADGLSRSEKLSIIGQLAAGVAHEIRNPLTTLKGFVQLQKSRGSISDSHLNIMLSELDRINFIVSEFLVLAKPQVIQFQSADVKNILMNIIMLLETQAALENIEFEMNLEPAIPHIHCESNQLKQVFLNVLKNAMEAMPQGGVIKIEMCHPNPEQIVVRFIDQGCGIPEEVLSRIGEPFFTSKENGTGLGLMVTEQIIHNHKGSISIQSRSGEGTCVEITLPVDNAVNK